ncbi:flagellar basal-body rod protein FlgB [Natranaerovirga pectinivora]|uniref:Flagellar basal body rod protein FlgB n=1 Tax=Natranaerovirga pectinivora TaxID=682400 RepID=A0A4R3MR49_9FIRM|nr:flagellar basal body rod protein FlgB [Natranaerovirga pectinivora]TCT16416.1 flagellar basal-body rod protein FlgB [Natranaerovirga pectinivora]
MNGKIFSNVNVMNKSLDASWLRNQVISENIANVDTPGYKRKDVVFENKLREALMSGRLNANELTPKVVQDKVNLQFRRDGNNVDIDVEMVELSKNQLRYNTLIEQVKHDFSRMKTAITSR